MAHHAFDIPYKFEFNLSLVVPAYNEEENVRAFFEEVLQVLGKIEGAFEIIFVDDGSTDETYSEIKRLIEDMVHLTDDVRSRFFLQAISFSRNFGQDAALYAGLQASSGQNIAFIDIDLEQPLSVLVDMYQELLANDDIDCVAGYQKRRRGSALRNFFSSKFYNLFAWMSHMEVVLNSSEFRVFRRNVATALLAFQERDRFTKGLFAWVGFNVRPHAFVYNKRHAGKTSYTMTGLFKYALLGLTSFSTVPLKIASYLGVGVSFAAIVYFLVVAGKRLFFGVEIPGYSTIVGLVLLLGGIQLLVLGAIGEYLARAYMQGKERPIYIARKHITSHEDLQYTML